MQILQKIKNYQEKEALIKSFSQNKSFGNIHQNNQYQSFNAKRQSDESTQDTKYNMNSTNVVGVYNNQYSNFLNDYTPFRKYQNNDNYQILQNDGFNVLSDSRYFSPKIQNY